MKISILFLKSYLKIYLLNYIFSAILIFPYLSSQICYCDDLFHKNFISFFPPYKHSALFHHLNKKNSISGGHGQFYFSNIWFNDVDHDHTIHSLKISQWLAYFIIIVVFPNYLHISLILFKIWLMEKDYVTAGIYIWKAYGGFYY